MADVATLEIGVKTDQIDHAPVCIVCLGSRPPNLSEASERKRLEARLSSG